MADAPEEELLEDAPVVTRPAPAHRVAGRAGRWWPPPAGAVDAVLVAVLAGLVLVVHDLGYVLHHPYWLDEAWVADSVHAPLHLVPFLTSSTPICWTLLLRLVPGSGSGQSARLVPLIFCALAAAAGYGLGVQLRLNRYLTGILVGAAVLLCPAMLARDDLKQYTAEAFASVLLLALTAWLTNGWSRRRLVVLGAALPLGILFAATSAFVGAAVLTGLAVETAATRRWRRLRELVVTGAAAGVASLIIYLTTIRPNVVPALKTYWNSYYLPRSGSLVSVVHLRLSALAPTTGFSHPVVVLLLALAGVAALIVHRRYALALAVPATMLFNVAAAVDRAYPFGDARTSTFWLVLMPVLFAVAAATVVQWSGRIVPALPIGITAGFLVLWGLATAKGFDSHPIANEDVRDQVTYFAAHYRPGDILVVDELASYGLAFYDPRLRPTYTHDPVLADGFLPEFPGDPWIVQMHNRGAADVTAAMTEANRLAHGSGRVWIIRTHMLTAEAEAWGQALAGKDAVTIATGPEPLVLYRPGGAPTGPGA